MDPLILELDALRDKSHQCCGRVLLHQLHSSINLPHPSLNKMTRTSSAGPSRRRPDSASPEPSAGPSTQRGGRTQLEESTARRRKARLSTREDLFRNQDPAEKLRIGTGYRELQKVADRKLEHLRRS